MQKENNIFYEYVKANKTKSLACLIVTIGISFVAPFKSFIIQWLIDAPTKEAAIKFLLLGAVITILSFLLELASRNLATDIRGQSIALIRSKLMNMILSDSMENYFKQGNSDGISVLTNDIQIINNDLYDAIYNIMLYGGMLLFAVGMLIYINASMLLYVLLASILPFVVPRLLDKKVQLSRKRYSNELSKYTSAIADMLKGFEIIHQFGVVDLFSQNHSEFAYETAMAEQDFNKRMNLNIAGSSFLSNILFYILLLLGMFLLFDGKVTVGYMVAATNLSNFIIAPCKMISHQYSRVKSTKAIRQKLQEIANISKCEQGEEISEIQQVLWENVSFKYEGMASDLLKNIDMSWEKNDKIALLGKSGSGKTSIIKLFCKYFDSYSGNIFLSQVELRQISKDSFYKSVGVIAQNPHLFNDTLRNNICLYEDFSEREIQNALLKSGIRDYVDNLPEGLDTMILENGKNLSGGQAQRIAIARAVIRNKKILIVDEGTTGLDVDTAERIMSDLLNMDAMVILITHDTDRKYLSKLNKIYDVVDGEVRLR